MKPTSHDVAALSRRERQIMDVLFEHGQRSAAQIRAELAESPSYSTVRTLLTRLENKGFIAHSEEGRTYIYRAAVRKEVALNRALARLLKTFFDDSRERAVAALLTHGRSHASPSELTRIAAMIEVARKEGR